MKRAFTLTELIFVIIIVSILAYFAANRFKKDTLTPASYQLLDHIKYTQSLALNQDMFVPSPYFATYRTNSTQQEKESKQWFKKWWQIVFHRNSSYSIFSDHPTTGSSNEFDRQPDTNGDLIAKDPLTSKCILGNLNGNGVKGCTKFEFANFRDKYHVEISKVKGCGRSKHLLFDSFGRPHCSKSSNDDDLNPYTEFLHEQFCIELTKDNDTNAIFIKPITGYAYIKFDNSCSKYSN